MPFARLALLAAAAAALAGCGRTERQAPAPAESLVPMPSLQPPPPAPAGPAGRSSRDQCGAEKVARFIGEPYDERRRAEIAQIVGDVEIRAFGESDPVTDDMRPGRLNIVHDAQRRIVKVACY